MEIAFVPCSAFVFFSGWELVLMLAVVLVLFGAKYLPELMNGFGTGIKEFRKATQEVAEELNRPPMASGPVYEALTHDNRTAEFVYPHRFESEEPRTDMVLFFAQGFGVGRMPFAPRTFGLLLGVIWFGALLATTRFELYLVGLLCGLGLSVWLCGVAEKILKMRNPVSVVIDEITAFPVCFLPLVVQHWVAPSKLSLFETFFTGRGLLVTAGVFIVFRLFDLIKPWPIRHSQRLAGGWGMTIDDVLVASYVALITLFFFVWIRP